MRNPAGIGAVEVPDRMQAGSHGPQPKYAATGAIQRRETLGALLVWIAAVVACSLGYQQLAARGHLAPQA